MLRLPLHLTLLLASISLISARNINLSRKELETLSNKLKVALQPDAHEKHKLLEPFHENGDHGKYVAV